MWLLFLFFSLVNCNRFPQERCNKDDCSVQLQPFQNESCLIHKTEVCRKSMSNFTQVPEIKLESEEDAKFSGFISPYVAEVDIRSKVWSYSAINISFSIHKKGVEALAMKIKGHNSTICRIFDFHSPGKLFSLPVTFFYDCLYYMAESQLQYFQMDMISLPSNEQLTYYVYIPDFTLIKTPCDWQPAIMVFRGGLSHGILKIKFSDAPQKFNISTYAMELVEKSSNKRMSHIIPSNKKANMLVAEFLSVPYGNYTVIVKPIVENRNNCAGAEIGIFQVGNSKPVLDIITVICICIIVVFIVCSLAVYKCCSLSDRSRAECNDAPEKHSSHKVDVAESQHLLSQGFMNKIELADGTLRNSTACFKGNSGNRSSRSSNEDEESDSSISDFDEEVAFYVKKYDNLFRLASK